MGDPIAAYQRQREKARSLYGTDDLATSIPPERDTPAISAALGLEIARFWLDETRLMVADRIGGPFAAMQGLCRDRMAMALRLLDSGKVPPSELMADIDRSCRLVVDPDEVHVVTGALTGLREQFVSIKVGALARRKIESGALIMDPTSARLFWTGARKVAINHSGGKWKVTSAEKWSAFLEGAADGVENVAEFAGKAAAKTLEVAGGALATGVGAFIDELGIVKVAVAGAVIYGAWRIL